ncbi:dolichyl-diphosphooligosaccharide--protein glycosyltransferase subunit 4A-like [Glycine soja]|nr:dolichyl-diphosphooligosaccharide--protein glycosyltransferase subunit 4A-like [Glycine soja]
MIDDEALGVIANILSIFIFALVIAYHLVTADPKYKVI